MVPAALLVIEMLVTTGPEPSSTMKNPPEVGRLTKSWSPAKKPLEIWIVALWMSCSVEGGVASTSNTPRPDESTTPGEPIEYAADGATLISTGASSTCVMLTEAGGGRARRRAGAL